MKLTTDVTLLFLSSVNVIFVYFLTLQLRNMALMESANTCCISDRVACTIKVNIKETFIGNYPFVDLFIW